ncbi:zeta toxin family protein [Luteolibacter flavescens]|uniref:Zeta toxin family protein n=1 Tax=Luteolibacter flavescens TaxID=1859460 RepID=A0ABT3FQR4_9BACT|nr:zeta toxin family protein [Luteolibacter flavescens]MCW1885802.1 zeta toxin family protein [Luteolibacter flavescens]
MRSEQIPGPPMPSLILIGGPNGAGKTTFAKEILTTDLKGLRFLNADEIARGLSPFDPDRVARKAGRILLGEIAELTRSHEDFALESTLSGRSHAHILQRAKEAGYSITLHFVWIPSAKVSLARVRQRVKKGGHNVPIIDIMRRYDRIMKNLIELYLPLADRWWIWSSVELRFTALASSETHAISDVEAFLSAP